jgi:mutator protein MutT
VKRLVINRRNKPKSPRKILLAVDAIVRNELGNIIIERRGCEPYLGKYALPGGHVKYGETVEGAALREIQEECGIKIIIKSILGVYSGTERDPRGSSTTIVFIADAIQNNIRAGDDAKTVEWMNLNEVGALRKEQLAFDHFFILKHYFDWTNLGFPSATFWSSKPEPGYYKRKAKNSRPIRVYISSSLKNFKLNQTISKVLNSIGYETFLPQEYTKEDAEARITYNEKRNIRDRNVAAILASDLVIIVGKNIGTITSWEIGFACGLKKPCILLDLQKNNIPDIEMLFYSIPRVLRLGSLKEEYLRTIFSNLGEYL